MAKYLLDTNVCISLFRNRDNVRKHILDVGIDNCYISEITIAELFFGLAKGADKQRLMNDISNVTKMFNILPVFPCFKEYGEIRCELEKAGNRIDQFDLLIGASAIHNKMTLVTANLKHFVRIKDLSVIDWK